MGWLRRNALTLATHGGSLVPLLLLLLDWWRDNLTANPIQAITQRTGYPALVLLVLSLACTPVNAATGWRAVMALRRPLGLYGFGYALIHLLIFVGLDYGFDWRLIREAVVEKRFVVAGVAALTLLVPLALTSTRGWMRRLGRRWKRLHRLIYLAVPLGVIHYVWLVKADYRQPALFGLIVAVLLIARLPPVRRQISALRHRLVRRDTAALTPTSATDEPRSSR